MATEARPAKRTGRPIESAQAVAEQRALTSTSPEIVALMQRRQAGERIDIVLPGYRQEQNGAIRESFGGGGNYILVDRSPESETPLVLAEWVRGRDGYTRVFYVDNGEQPVTLVDTGMVGVAVRLTEATLLANEKRASASAPVVPVDSEPVEPQDVVEAAVAETIHEPLVDPRSGSGVLTTVTNSVTGVVTHRELTRAELAALTGETGIEDKTEGLTTEDPAAVEAARLLAETLSRKTTVARVDHPEVDTRVHIPVPLSVQEVKGEDGASVMEAVVTDPSGGRQFSIRYEHASQQPQVSRIQGADGTSTFVLEQNGNGVKYTDEGQAQGYIIDARGVQNLNLELAMSVAQVQLGENTRVVTHRNIDHLEAEGANNIVVLRSGARVRENAAGENCRVIGQALVPVGGHAVGVVPTEVVEATAAVTKPTSEAREDRSLPAGLIISQRIPEQDYQDRPLKPSEVRHAEPTPRLFEVPTKMKGRRSFEFDAAEVLSYLAVPSNLNVDASYINRLDELTVAGRAVAYKVGHASVTGGLEVTGSADNIEVFGKVVEGVLVGGEASVNILKGTGRMSGGFLSIQKLEGAVIAEGSKERRAYLAIDKMQEDSVVVLRDNVEARIPEGQFLVLGDNVYVNGRKMDKGFNYVTNMSRDKRQKSPKRPFVQSWSTPGGSHQARYDHPTGGEFRSWAPKGTIPPGVVLTPDGYKLTRVGEGAKDGLSRGTFEVYGNVEIPGGAHSIVAYGHGRERVAKLTITKDKKGTANIDDLFLTGEINVVFEPGLDPKQVIKNLRVAGKNNRINGIPIEEGWKVARTKEELLEPKTPRERKRVYYGDVSAVIASDASLPDVSTEGFTYTVKGDMQRLDASVRVTNALEANIDTAHSYGSATLTVRDVKTGMVQGASTLFAQSAETLKMQGLSRPVKGSGTAEAIVMEGVKVVELSGNALAAIPNFERNAVIIVTGTGNGLRGQVTRDAIAEGVYVVQGGQLLKLKGDVAKEVTADPLHYLDSQTQLLFGDLDHEQVREAARVSAYPSLEAIAATFGRMAGVPDAGVAESVYVWTQDRPITEGLDGLAPDERIVELNRRGHILADAIGPTLPSGFGLPEEQLTAVDDSVLSEIDPAQVIPGTGDPETDARLVVAALEESGLTGSLRTDESAVDLADVDAAEPVVEEGSTISLTDSNRHGEITLAVLRELAGVIRDPRQLSAVISKAMAAGWAIHPEVIPYLFPAAATDDNGDDRTSDERPTTVPVASDAPLAVAEPDVVATSTQTVAVPEHYQGGIRVVFHEDELGSDDSGSAHMMRHPDTGAAMPRVVQRRRLPAPFQQWTADDLRPRTR